MTSLLNGQSQTIPFTEKAQSLGINYSFIPDIISDYGLGISFFDANIDGFDDIAFGGLQDESIHIYLFDTLTNSYIINSSTGINNLGYRSKCLLWVDYDNDGDKDLSITSIEGPVKLFQNIGNFSFTDATIPAGIDTIFMNSYAASWADYNKDGWLDFYVINRNSSESGNQNMLYKNNQDGTFTNVTDESGVADNQGLGLAVSFLDFNKDSWPDIYIANDKAASKNVLFMNLGNGQFENVSDSLTTGIRMDAMGLAIGDYNKNGYEDIYITNTPASSPTFGGNVLLNNKGDGTFEDLADILGLRVYSTSWGTSTADFNNDGHLDIFVSNEGPTNEQNTNSLFINLGDGQFIQDTLNDIYTTYKRSYGNAVGDFNNDGFNDIAVMNILNHKVSLYKNNSLENNWLKVNLEGIESNRDGIGSWIKTYYNNTYSEIYTRCGSSYGSQSSDNYIIGLGNAEKADSIIVNWPSGIIDTHYSLSPNQTYHFVEGVQFIDSSMIDTTATSSFTNLFNESIFSVYPNPFKNKIVVESETRGILEITIINTLGNTIFTSKVEQRATINLSEQPAGYYFIKAITHEGQFIRQLIKH